MHRVLVLPCFDRLVGLLFDFGWLVGISPLWFLEKRWFSPINLKGVVGFILSFFLLSLFLWL